jgi:3-oxoacyl-[acyl-carrier protein] reductase
MVVGVDLNAEKLEALATARNGYLLPYVGSVADPEFAEASVRDVNSRFGSIRGLVNDAGITRRAMMEKMRLHSGRVDARHIWREDALRAFARA